MITVTTENITPQIAQNLLDNTDFENRKILKQNSAKIVRAMGRGDFIGLASTPIVISDKGNVIDGQHRLLGIVYSEISQDMIVSRGISEDDYVKMDNFGVNKPNSNVLKVLGFDYSTEKAAATKYFMNFKHYADTGKMGNFNPLASESEELINDYGDAKLTEICRMAGRLYGWPKMRKAPTTGILMYAMKDSSSLDVAEEFTAGVAESKGIYDGDPRLLIQKYCSVRHAHNRDDTIFYINAWNTWVKGDSRKNFWKIDGTTRQPVILTADNYAAR